MKISWLVRTKCSRRTAISKEMRIGGSARRWVRNRSDLIHGTDALAVEGWMRRRAYRPIFEAGAEMYPGRLRSPGVPPVCRAVRVQSRQHYRRFWCRRCYRHRRITQRAHVTQWCCTRFQRSIRAACHGAPLNISTTSCAGRRTQKSVIDMQDTATNNQK